MKDMANNKEVLIRCSLNGLVALSRNMGSRKGEKMEWELITASLFCLTESNQFSN